ncbi:MAG: hypothetical protein MUF87_11620 [Anaerolineae bacterium]|jgi:hypothetical protein|nr:hypothetical protein [Anaerolineae bacterium]
MLLEHVTAKHFEPYLDQIFELHYNPQEAPLTLTLTKVKSWGPEDRQPRQAFTLTFQSTITAYLPQATYHYQHPDPAIGALELFTVPIGPNQAGMEYEVIFT